MTFYDFIHKKSGGNTDFGGLTKSDLAEHDKRVHPHGWKPGDNCTLREKEGKQQKAEKKVDELKVEEIEKAEPIDPSKVPNEAMVAKQSGIVNKMEAMAKEWHKQSKPRRGKDQKPYIVHPEAVVALLKSWGFNEKDNPVTIGVGWGHDLLEETDIEPEKIGDMLGESDDSKKIVDGIRLLSMDDTKQFKSASEKDEYKKAYIKNIAKTASPEVLAVKIADRLCNTKDFCADGNPWGREYLKLGEPLFERIDEIPHAEEIRKSLQDVRQEVSKLPEFGLPKASALSAPYADMEGFTEEDFDIWGDLLSGHGDDDIPPEDYDEKWEENRMGDDDGDLNTRAEEEEDYYGWLAGNDDHTAEEHGYDHVR